MVAPGWVSPLFRERRVSHWFSSREAPTALWIAQHLAGDAARPAQTRQVHGGRCVVARECVDGAVIDADAIVCADPMLVPVILTADCVPLLVLCKASRTCAAIHAGWRGIGSDIVRATIEMMREKFGAEPASMSAAMGPCAGRSAYEVGEDVIRTWTALGLSSALRPTSTPGKALADCPLAVRILLEREGIASTSVDIDPPCSITDERFASHRREPANTNRMRAGISLGE